MLDYHKTITIYSNRIRYESVIIFPEIVVIIFRKSIETTQNDNDSFEGSY